MPDAGCRMPEARSQKPDTGYLLVWKRACERSVICQRACERSASEAICYLEASLRAICKRSDLSSGSELASGLIADSCNLPSMSTVAVVVAAEPGEGFEGSKYLTVVHGTPMLEGIVREVARWPVDDVIVVLGSDGEQIAEQADLGATTIIIDPGWSEGESSPIRAALDLVTRDRSVDLIVLVRGDQPGVEGSVAEALIDAARQEGADAVTPRYRYAQGWPVVIGPSLWDRFLSIEGGLDVHDVIATHANTSEEVWVDHLEPRVIAVQDDLRRDR